jgi:alkanesulfonate monooxygenase SsuD/methylene tetrahydromethanopterin reductase-like flavin-dependent oxidoreductase (luciferase family)
MSKTEALRLADALMTLFPSREEGERAAAELRRLHAENAGHRRNASLIAMSGMIVGERCNVEDVNATLKPSAMRCWRH